MECRMFGLTKLDLRKMAFDLTEINKIYYNFCKKTATAGKPEICLILIYNFKLVVLNYFQKAKID